MKYPLLISMFLTSTALADTWTVDDDGAADFSTIQEALEAATTGDTIKVFPGIYTSTSNEAVALIPKRPDARLQKESKRVIQKTEQLGVSSRIKISLNTPLNTTDDPLDGGIRGVSI